MHLKVFVKLKKTLKTLSSGQKKPKKKPKKNQKTQKKPKKPLGWFFKKKLVFSTLPGGHLVSYYLPQTKWNHVFFFFKANTRLDRN
jgi:hypothetical protein